MRTAVDAAASQRRRRTASRQRWRLAPWMAAGCLGVAAATRWLHGPAVLPLAVLSAAAAIVIVRTYAARAGRASDLDAATIDEDAGLAGELRSATWFAALPERDLWAECHLARAATRLRGILLAAAVSSGFRPPRATDNRRSRSRHPGAVDDVAVRGAP